MTDAPQHNSRPPWYRNARGEWYVLAQFVLLPLVAFGPRTLPIFPKWGGVWAGVVGGVLLATGLGLVLAGVLWLGRNLTPSASPRDGSVLLECGPYRLVRHPIYAGLFLGALGWAFWVQGFLTFGWALLLLLLLDRKASLEERWLTERFPGYAAYRQRVRKLIPFLY